jgi:hypothetical protein
MTSTAVQLGDHKTSGTSRLALHQFSYDLRALVRNRQSQFFTLASPSRCPFFSC